LREFYKLGKKIGDGAFGKVYIVTHRTTGAKRACKTLSKSGIEKAMGDKNKFMAEVEILKSMDHPNILKLYEVFEDQKQIHLVTELCTGGELFDFIIMKHKFSEATAAHFMKQVLEAVVYCHRRSIVHRDLKPENLLLETKDETSAIKVIDFGTSALISPDRKLS
jgi:calcium-dependent protein kinase